jgi:hypothetical protein
MLESEWNLEDRSESDDFENVMIAQVSGILRPIAKEIALTGGCSD